MEDYSAAVTTAAQNPGDSDDINRRGVLSAEAGNFDEAHFWMNRGIQAKN